MIINGLPFINLEDWKKHTVYKGEYSAKHKNIVWFWNVLGELD